MYQGPVESRNRREVLNVLLHLPSTHKHNESNLWTVSLRCPKPHICLSIRGIFYFFFKNHEAVTRTFPTLQPNSIHQFFWISSVQSPGTDWQIWLGFHLWDLKVSSCWPPYSGSQPNTPQKWREMDDDLSWKHRKTPEGSLHIRKSINVIHYINKLKRKITGAS